MHPCEKNISPDSSYYIYTASSTAKKMLFYPVCTGYFRYEPGYRLVRNSYDSFLIMVITKGSLSVTANGRTCQASKGNVVLLDCYAPHQYETASGCEALWLHFDGPMSRTSFEAIHANCGTVFYPKNAQILFYNMKKIRDSFCDKLPIQETDLSLRIHSILNELLLGQPSPDSKNPSQRAIANTISYINEHFTENLSLDALARHCSLSPFYFTRVFERETGMSPHQYILMMRIAAAKFLLKTTELPVKEIGLQCGFSSESSFCNTFRKWEKQSPSQYRET